MEKIFLRFPGGKDKALTLSYDDGMEQDIRLVDIMKKNGLKGTFNINSGCYAEEGTVYPEEQIHRRRLTLAQAKALYINSGMEVAVHAVNHPFLDRLPLNRCNYEVLQDRINLEEDFECIVRGMAYPFGTYSDDVVNVLKSCGIMYSRTVQSTGNFEIPTDWLRMPATCHHNEPRLMELAETFLHQPDRYGKAKLFYLWGHSYEFDDNDNWNVIEEFAEFIAHKDDVWYATNIEVYDYIQAYKNLVFSTMGKKVYNPSCLDVYFYADGKDYRVKSGETVNLE